MKLDAQGRAESWQSTPKNFLFNHGTLIRVYKAKVADELRAAGLYDELYGWMSANSKLSMTEVKWLVWIVLGWTFWLASGHAPQAEKLTAAMKCRECGGEMRVVEVTYSSLGSLGVRIEHGLAFFDSG